MNGYLSGTSRTQTINGQIELLGNGLVYYKERPNLEVSRVIGITKPTTVYQGMIRGFSLPIYNSDNEELFFDVPSVTARWDGLSNPILCFGGYLDTANNVKKFQLACDWTKFTAQTDILEGTSLETAKTGDITTGNWAQYHTWSSTITLDYDVLPADPLASGDCMDLRLYRVAADDSGNEIAGEVVITGAVIKWRLNKFYSSS
ncbi:MAG: hypothetical protein PH343_07210 [Nitrospira sp.]|nr:hypothetical protein [Nitrospira sp.]